MIEKLDEFQHGLTQEFEKINEIIDWINYWEGRERNKNKAMPSDKSPESADSNQSSCASKDTRKGCFKLIKRNDGSMVRCGGKFGDIRILSLQERLILLKAELQISILKANQSSKESHRKREEVKHD